MHRSFNDLSVGDRYLTGALNPSFFSRSEILLWTLVRRDADEIVAQDESGREIVIQREGGGTWRVANVTWTAPLPSGPAEFVKNYARALDSQGTRSRSLFLHIEEVDGAHCRGRLVSQVHTPARDGDFVFADDADHGWTSEVEGNAVFWDRLIEIVLPEDRAGTLGRGDLVAAVDPVCREVAPSNFVFDVAEPLVLGRSMDRAAVGAFMPPGGHLAYLHGPARPDQVEGEMGIAHQRTLPNEALVLWYSDGGSDTACVVLSSTGTVFYRTDCLADVFYNLSQPQGLYVFENAKGWSYRSYEGEYDSGIDGDWRPATIEDVTRFGFDEASLEREIADNVEVELGVGVLELIASAEAGVSQTSPA